MNDLEPDRRAELIAAALSGELTPEEGAERAREVIERAVGAAYAEDIAVGVTDLGDRDRVDVRIRTTVPLIGRRLSSERMASTAT